MTLETEPVARPKPRSRPPTRRTPPRKDDVARHPNGTVDTLAEMQRQIAELTTQVQGGMRTVASEPYNPIGPQREAAAEELTPWQLRVRERTEPTPKNLERGREKAYNYAAKWYMKADGSVVSLQGDPQNFTYYTDKKRFHALSDAEVREYLSVERPKIVKLQQEKASLINTIRRAVAVDPALAAGLDPSWETDLDKMSIPELQEQLAEIGGMPTANGAKRRLMKRLPRLQDADNAAAEAEAKRLLEGVETNKRDMEEFDRVAGIDRPNMPSARRTRDIEVTPRNAAQFR